MASNRSPYLWPAVTIVAGILLLIVALPAQHKTWAPAFLRAPSFQFGLDLAGGTQLDFRVSENEINAQIAELDKRIAELESQGGGSEELTNLRNDRAAVISQRDNLIEAIRTVLERRINALGVSEATITPSYMGGEKHLLVECPGVIDVQQCIATVGKTIQLEFKEEFTEATTEYEQSVRDQVAAAKRRITGSGVTLEVLGQDLGSQLGTSYNDSRTLFRDLLPKGMEGIWDRTPADGVIEYAVTLPTLGTDAQGNQVQDEAKGIMLAQVVTPRAMTGRVIQEAPKAFDMLVKTEQDLSYTLHENKPLDAALPTKVISTIRGMQPGELKSVVMDDGTAKVLFLRGLTPGREEADVSHILVSYQGASQAEPTVTRTKEQALQRAQDLKNRLNGGANFVDLARAESDGPSKQNGGKIGVVGRGEGLVDAYEDYAFTAQAGSVSDPIDSPFGYFLVRVDKAASTTVDKASFDSLSVNGQNAGTRAEEIVGRMQRGEVKTQEEAIAIRSLFFSLQPTGWKDTQLDGKHFRTAAVVLDPTTNRPIVQITFDTEGGKLFQEMTKRNIGKQIAIFVGGELVSAPTVQSEIAGGTAVITGTYNIQEAQQLATDLNTGAIPAPIYLSGQRTVEATLGAQALSTSVKAALYGVVALALFLIVIYRFLGVLAMIGLAVYALIFVVLLKMPLFLVSSQQVVLTLAGVAGMILSIGLAIDTNVLVYERMKEELRKGKLLKTAVDVGFERAWPSIRDSNISTLITCGLLFLIGTSIVRGFALTLAIGVIISMFSGMVVVRWLARQTARSSLATKPALFPGMQPQAAEAAKA
jgi:protein-export membrane protein SecD